MPDAGPWVRACFNSVKPSVIIEGLFTWLILCSPCCLVNELCYKSKIGDFEKSSYLQFKKKKKVIILCDLCLILIYLAHSLRISVKTELFPVFENAAETEVL